MTSSLDMIGCQEKKLKKKKKKKLKKLKKFKINKLFLYDVKNIMLKVL